jgi:hypothetical protein
MKTDKMCLQKVISKKLWEKTVIFVGILSATDEKSKSVARIHNTA